MEINEHFNRVIPGTFEFTSEGDYYVINGSKLKISNLATGSKMFSIIKVLLDKGEIDNTTMLILDEPEAHLHPMWQNAFAEIIVLLVKKLGVNILLTTHSPNFMLALDGDKAGRRGITKIAKFLQRHGREVRVYCVPDNEDINSMPSNLFPQMAIMTFREWSKMIARRFKDEDNSGNKDIQPELEDMN